jgi:hypothetical protein
MVAVVKSEIAKGIKAKRAAQKYNHTQRIKNFNISPEAFERMREAQGGKCAICDRLEADCGRKLAIDHCHRTGKVRGLLCSPCNTGLGCFKDSTETLALAISYLLATCGVRESFDDASVYTPRNSSFDVYAESDDYGSESYP